MKLTELEVATIGQAIEELDHLWELDASRGLRDCINSAEYERVSLAPVLRRLVARSQEPATPELRSASEGA